MTQRQGFLAWIGASALFMLVGAFGPWVKALGTSVSGTDGSNDGWIVVGAAVVCGALIAGTWRYRAAGIWPLLAGLAGAAVTIYDRHNVQNKIKSGGELIRAVASVGWGLNLALIASISLAIAGVVWLTQVQDDKSVGEGAADAPGSEGWKLNLRYAERDLARRRYGDALVELRTKATEAKAHDDADGLRSIAEIAEELARRDDFKNEWQRDSAQSLAQEAREAAHTAANNRSDASATVAASQHPESAGEDSALRILRERYARGELTRDEFQQLKMDVTE